MTATDISGASDDKKSVKGLVSVVIPTYGARGELQRSVDSALGQSYPDTEVFVVDDNEPGTPARSATEKIMECYSADSRVTYIRHEHNRNGAAARNTGIRAAHGEFIAFLDDDDFFLPEKITRQLAFMQEHPEFDAAYCMTAKEGKPIPMRPYEGDASLPLLMGKTSMYTPSIIFRCPALESIGGFDERFRRHQDYELLLRFFAAGGRIGCVKEILLELGSNRGENIPHGDALEQIKKTFLGTFADVITRLDRERPGTARKIETYHYSRVFIDHLKMRHYKRAVQILIKYFPKAPGVFCSTLAETAKAHLRR